MSDGINHFNGSYDELMADIATKNGLCVIDFFATWCGPCQRLGQILPDIAKENPNVTFYKVDIDQNSEAAAKFWVRSIPHIAFMKENKEVDHIVGADIAGIKANISKYQ